MKAAVTIRKEGKGCLISVIRPVVWEPRSAWFQGHGLTSQEGPSCLPAGYYQPRTHTHPPHTPRLHLNQAAGTDMTRIRLLQCVHYRWQCTWSTGFCHLNHCCCFFFLKNNPLVGILMHLTHCSRITSDETNVHVVLCISMFVKSVSSGFNILTVSSMQRCAAASSHIAQISEPLTST